MPTVILSVGISSDFTLPAEVNLYLMAQETVINLPNHKKGNTFPGHHYYALNPDLSEYILTDCEIKASFKLGSPTGTIVATFALTTGFTMISAALGHFFLNERVINWAVGKYYYDIQITRADDTVDTPIVGTWTITQDITPTT